MKLKKLDITNIASISKASIDFTSAPLADSPIFLICGETGSGKSTILDAICLALYNKTPRLANGKKTEENVYKEGRQEMSIVSVNQLLKKGEKEGSISLLFEGADGTDYVAEWSCRVNRNGRLEDESWTITDSKGHSDSSKGTARNNKMTGIIGLDYLQFCRTSMLAQGQFTQFLKADTKDKSDILEKITGTEIYAEIGTRIHKKANDARKAAEKAEDSVSAVVLLPQEEKEAHQQEIAQIDELIGKNTASLQMLDSLVKAFEAIETAEDTISKSGTTLERAKATFAALTCDIAARKASLQEDRQKADALSELVDQQKDNAAMYANVQAIESELGNITKQRGIMARQQEILTKESKALEDESEIIKELEDGKAQAEETLGQKDKAVADAVEAKKALDPEGVEKERQAIAGGLDLTGKAKVDYVTITSKKEKLATDKTDYAKAGLDIAADKEAMAAVKEKAASAELDYKEVKDTYDRQAQALDAASVSLREWIRESGVDECPVCHSKITALLTDEQEEDRLRPLKDLLEKKKASMEDAAASLTQARTALSTKEATHETAKGRIEEAEGEISRLDREFAEKYSRLGITGAEDDLLGVLKGAEDSLNARKEVNEAAITAVGKKQKAIEEATKDRDAFKKDTYDKVVSDLAKADKAKTEIKGRIDAAKKMYGAAEVAEKESMDKADQMITATGWLEAWEKDTEAFTTRLKDEAKVYNDAVKALEEAGKRIEQKEKDIKEASEVHDRILATDGGFEPENIVPAAFQGNAIREWGAIENSISTALKDISTSRESMKTSRETIDKAFETDASLPQSKDELQGRKAIIAKENIDKSGRRGELKRAIEEDDRKTAELEDLIKARNEARSINAKWNTLDDLFGGKDGFTFKKIAQSYIMQDILNHANAYLKKIAPRYELTAQPGSLVILVKDNDEGGVRSGNTLSGGEGFVISLSLALGLSSLAENSISVDTIFIDEGFGTLSQEWLNSVMAALEKLNSTSGKHVGIISHIEDLQKRIPTVIEVRKTNATTSEIGIRG